PNNGAILASGGPYTAADANTTVIESVCLDDDCYDFVIRDAGLDGISAGGGSYTVTTSGTVIASGGDFGAREVTNFCLDGTPTAAALAGTAGSRDALEVTNFGSANLDVSCLMIERVFAAGSETFALPTGTTLAPGGVLTIHFGNGHDDPANNVFYVPGTSDLPINEPTAYILSLSRSILDIAVMNGFDITPVLIPLNFDLRGLAVADYWSGNISPLYGGSIVRTTVWDTNTADDFVPGEACIPTTIGVLNPMLPQPTPNGGATAIQAQPTTRIECTPFTITVTDDEAAVCGLYSDYTDYTGSATINAGECVETVITVTDAFNISDLNLGIVGSAGDLGNLTVTLISPEGTAIELIDAICAGTDGVNFVLDGDFGSPVNLVCAMLASGNPFMPVGDIEGFNGEAVQGDWIVQVGHNNIEDAQSATFDYTLSISARDPYDQGDETLNNDPGLCGAEFTWNHPILFDNCPGGSVLLEIIFEEDEIQQTTPLPIFPVNTQITYFFEVGTTEVRYTLTDAAGNESVCSFEVEVLDIEFPTLTCPPDMVIQLAGGECTYNAYPTVPVTADDNCPGFTFSAFPPGTPVPIGDTIITLTVTDASGNATDCTYDLSILEFVPVGPPACITNQNVTLGEDCEAEITADMVLSGDDYRCYDNYVVNLFEQLPNGEAGDSIITSPLVGIEYVGQEIIAEVCDPATGLCCWGYVLIEFKDAPEFICPADTTVVCTASTLPSATGRPIVTSCVPGGADIDFDDVVTDNGMCGDPRMVIERTWTVTDGEGNSSDCVQTITIAAFDLDQVIFPRDWDGIDTTVIDCAAALADPSVLSTDSLGVPTIDGTTPIDVLSFCSAALNMTEERFDICENSYIIFRTWRVINQCDENPLLDAITHVQTIRVEDADGPDIICPADETISTAPNDCRANYTVPDLMVVDACSDVI
ncbi:MAG: HYR domain-containing protein, partial [Bacteroidota bacterium]